jgi:hypothetical protein
MFLHQGDNKDAQCETTVPVDQDRNNRSLQKRWSEDLKKCYISDEMDRREDKEEVGNGDSEHEC